MLSHQRLFTGSPNAVNSLVESGVRGGQVSAFDKVFFPATHQGLYTAFAEAVYLLSDVLFLSDFGNKALHRLWIASTKVFQSLYYKLTVPILMDFIYDCFGGSRGVGY